MSISSRSGMALLAAAVAGVVAACGAESGECLRFTDCAEGLTCADGRCVPPPPPGTTTEGEGGTSSATPEGGASDNDAGGEEQPGLFDEAGLFDDAPAD